MRGKDILKGLVADPSAAEAKSKAVPHRTTSVVREMGRTLDTLNEEVQAAQQLREQLAAGEQVVDLDPNKIEDSIVRDRIPGGNDPDHAFEELKRSISDSGQQVPILVRLHPEGGDRYQVAYGHRRLRVARELGQQVRAIVKTLTDEELVLAQGQENGSRVDLSFIEKALFALRMEGRGFDRPMILKALSVHNPDLSNLLQVAKGVPTDIIMAIGPAPKIGRPRWLALVEKLRDNRLSKLAVKEVNESTFATLPSDQRFDRLWKAIAARGPIEDASTTFQNGKGIELVTIMRSKRSGKASFASVEFTEFLASKMPELIKEFEKG